jgi:hypothetical protein
VRAETICATLPSSCVRLCTCCVCCYCICESSVFLLCLRRRITHALCRYDNQQSLRVGKKAQAQHAENIFHCVPRIMDSGRNVLSITFSVYKSKGRWGGWTGLSCVQIWDIPKWISVKAYSPSEFNLFVKIRLLQIFLLLVWFLNMRFWWSWFLSGSELKVFVKSIELL